MKRSTGSVGCAENQRQDKIRTVGVKKPKLSIKDRTNK